MDFLHGIQNIFVSAFHGDQQSILLIFSVYMLVVCSYSLVYQIRINRWPSTKGRLIHSRLEKVPAVKLVKGHQRYVADALYEYSVNGQKYTGKRISPWVVVATHNIRVVLVKQLLKIQKDSSGSINVFYNPAEPNKSFLVKPGMVGQLVTVAAGLASAIVYMAKYH